MKIAYIVWAILGVISAATAPANKDSLKCDMNHLKLVVYDDSRCTRKLPPHCQYWGTDGMKRFFDLNPLCVLLKTLDKSWKGQCVSNSLKNFHHLRFTLFAG